MDGESLEELRKLDEDERVESCHHHTMMSSSLRTKSSDSGRRLSVQSHRSTGSNDSAISSAHELRAWHHGGTDAAAGGTPDYLAPELLDRDETLNHGSPVDLWAIGVMLYEFLLGTYPLECEL